MKKAKNLFTEDEQKKIEEAVGKAEKTTSGEIAVMILDESDKYIESTIYDALILSGLFSILVPVLTKKYEIWFYLPAVFILYAVFYFLIAKIPELKRLFTSSERMSAAVRKRAIIAFYEKGLYRTRDETGILIFLSLLEKKVWILGDKGINAKIPENFWVEIANEISRGMFEKTHCNAMISAIEKCSKELTKYFPIKPDDTNELSNKVIF
jgi:putative membrane protein